MTEYELVIKPGEINFAPQTQAEEIIQNVITICSTLKYTVPMDRELGVEGIFLDEAVNRSRAKYTQEIMLAVRKFEPRADITRITFEGDLDGNVYPHLWIKFTL